MIFHKPAVILLKTEEGIINKSELGNEIHPSYADAVFRYTTYLDPLFHKASKTNEFQFILTLLRYRGIQYPGPDAYDNSLKFFDSVMDILHKLKGNNRLNMMLWLYGHIVESSEPYEIIANMLKIVLGGNFTPFNFPKKKTRWGFRNQYPSEKILILDSLAKAANMEEVTRPIKEVYDRELRNAVFHADYSVDNGEIFLNDPPKVYDKNKTLTLSNRSLAYHESIKNLIDSYRLQYSSSIQIKVSPSFSQDPDERATLIVRAEYGVIAMKDSWSKSDLQSGKVNWLIGKFFSYEKKMIDRGIVNLPRNRIDPINRLLSFFPSFMSRKLVKIIEKYFL